MMPFNLTDDDLETPLVELERHGLDYWCINKLEQVYGIYLKDIVYHTPEEIGKIQGFKRARVLSVVLAVRRFALYQQKQRERSCK